MKAGRISRFARIATSSELLYLLNLLYNMPSECCEEYKLIQLYQKSSVWCFAFSHTFTFELIPSVATATPGAWVTVTLERRYGPRRLRDDDDDDEYSRRTKMELAQSASQRLSLRVL